MKKSLLLQFCEIFWPCKREKKAREDYELGKSFTNQGGPVNEQTGVQYYEAAAYGGHAAAQYELGCRYARGRGVRKDEAKAVEWYQKSADQGYAGAQINLGLMYADGRVVPKDEAKADQWFQNTAIP